jgi:hypothetical protein
MFKLAESRGSIRGLYCGVEGLSLGPSPLIELLDGTYRVRPPREIAALVAAAFDPPPDAVKLLPRLFAISRRPAAWRSRPGDDLGRAARIW